MKQTRFIPIEDCNLQLREGAEGQPSRTVVGRPIMFGVRSKNLTPWNSTRVVYEILERGCITQELINRSDVVYNNNHSNDISNIIGRWRMGKGTLTIRLYENYVEIECEYPNTTVANDTLEQIRLGNVFGMSFAFADDYEDTENGVSYERTNETVDGKEVWLRHVKLITGLFDVANVTFPAYEQTTVATREQADEINAAIEAQLKREREAEEEAQRRACGGNGKDDEREDDPDDHNDPDDKGETDEEREAREKAEREAEEEQRERERMAAQRRHQRNRAHRISSEILESLEY